MSAVAVSTVPQGSVSDNEVTNQSNRGVERRLKQLVAPPVLFQLPGIQLRFDPAEQESKQSTSALERRLDQLVQHTLSQRRDSLRAEELTGQRLLTSHADDLIEKLKNWAYRLEARESTLVRRERDLQFTCWAS